MFPYFVKVRLEQGDVIQRCLQAIPFMHHFVGVCLIPQKCCRDPTHPERCEFHGLTGGADFTEITFRNVVFMSHHGQLSAWITLATGRLSQQEQGNQHG